MKLLLSVVLFAALLAFPRPSPAAEPARALADLASTNAFRGQEAAVRPVPGGGVRVETKAGARWPGVTFAAPGDGWNLSTYSRIEAEVRNPGKVPLTVHLRVDDAKTQKGAKANSAHADVAPGASAVVSVPLSRRPYRLSKPLDLVGMRGAPGMDETTDPSAVTRALLFVSDPKETKTFEVLRLEARGAGAVRTLDADTFLPFIDPLGQFMHADWPGKAKDAADLAARRAPEAADLAAHPAPADRDRWGGWAAGPQLKATGSFRVEKLDGRWWFVDPDGRLFWSFGADCVRSESATPVTEREAYYKDLPAPDGPMARFYSRRSGAAHGYYEQKRNYRQFDFGGVNLMRKYGSDWEKAWIPVAHDRLRSWGLNTVANWSDAAVCAARRTPYTANASFSSKLIEGSEGYWGKFPDPYDPSFAEGIRGAMEKQKAAGAVGDPWCIGFFVHNELGWGKETSLAVAALRSPPGQPAKKAVVDAVRQAYGGIGSLNAAWGTSYASWDDFLASTNAPDPKKAQSDLEKLYARIADRYFRVLREEVRRAAPGQMYFGCRFAWVNDIAVRAAAPHCDVVSFNKYTYTLDDFRLPEGVDKPVVVGEFHFGALDRGMFHTGLKATADQADRAAKFRAYLESGLRHPVIVGAHWFQYRDQATTGRSDGENYQIGLVDICDSPYPETIAACRAVGAEMYQLRSGAAQR